MAGPVSVAGKNAAEMSDPFSMTFGINYSGNKSAASKKLANEQKTAEAEEGARLNIERGADAERAAVSKMLMDAAMGAETTIGLTDEQKKAAEFLTKVMGGDILPIDAQTRAAMLAQAQDPLAAEFAAAQTYNRNLYGGRGFGTGGGGELESLRQLRMGTLQESARAGQNVLVSAANANMGARLNAANTQASLGNQSAGIRSAAMSNLTNYLLNAPASSRAGFVPKVNVPITTQGTQNPVQF